MGAQGLDFETWESMKFNHQILAVPSPQAIVRHCASSSKTASPLITNQPLVMAGGPVSSPVFMLGVVDGAPSKPRLLAVWGGKAGAFAFHELRSLRQLNVMKCSDSACWNRFQAARHEPILAPHRPLIAESAMHGAQIHVPRVTSARFCLGHLLMPKSGRG